MKKYSFTKEDRLLHSWQFKRVYENGEKFVGRLLVLYVLKVALREKKLGITVTKKRGKACRRNRIKRVIREAYRLMKYDLKDGFNIVFIARDKSVQEGVSLADINKEMISLLTKANIYELSE